MTDDLVKRLRAFSEKNVAPLAKAAMMEAAACLSQGEPVAYQWRYKYTEDEWGPWQSERRADAGALLANTILLAEEKRPLYAAPQLPAVAVKPLEWTGPDVNGDWHARSVLCVYAIRKQVSRGYWLTEVGNYFPTLEAAKAAAQANCERRLLPAITLSPAGVTEEKVEAPRIRAAVEALTNSGAGK